MQWIPLEANPVVLNDYLEKLGVTTAVAFTDVWGLDEESLQMLPPPVTAILLLFPITKSYEEYRLKQNEKIQAEGQTISKKLYFTNQTIGYFVE
jgi:ubiquitin carboxyl-terminal hydrolase L3